MPIVLVRVDERLVHGQVLEGWLPSLRAQELLVANDALAEDTNRRTIMESAVPLATRLVVDTVDKIAEFLIENLNGDVRRMILVNDPMDALRLRRAGVLFDSLNLGNFRTEDCSVLLSRSVAVGDEALTTLRDILDEGVRINIQSVPFETAIDLFDVCRTTEKT